MSPNDPDPRQQTPAAERDRHTEQTQDLPGTPEDERSRLATHRDPTLRDKAEAPEEKDPKGSVEWARVSDLAARAGAATTQAGMDFNREVLDAARQGLRDGRQQMQQRLAQRGAELDVDSPERTSTRRGPGREGVSL
ncbi:hypothetical protein VVR84_14090 [Kocuria carniphila]|uniref:Uncharacterized protein n=1 Tax=Kocuria carniphila TaxID=262208 RepID=A0ABV3V504_9MICC